MDSEAVLLRIPQELLDFIDEWIASRPEPRPSRQDAIRHSIELRMLKEGALARPLTHPEWGELDLNDDAKFLREKDDG